ncbi:putative bifunctional diguanylate cyclase/phosphodiesterase [Tepidiphilus baoligensis]|uniref:EAL domain-containing protein n=1 Tax=Tepidiphilus baoligensis TaxID=2698687 RepID=A0ABX1QIT4_9PROT|nr:EAL domain-containing protein [Tepidiphilus baoligensis]NMH15923.1 EAL domain-containing protein [Tepidiphilus baoligensis]
MTESLALVLCPSPTERATLLAVLESLGYEALVADTPEGAIALFERRHPDLVVLEDGEGLPSLLRELRQRRRHEVEFFVMTHAEEDALRALEAGASEVALTPLHPALLRHRLQRLHAERLLQRHFHGLQQLCTTASRIAGILGWGWRPDEDRFHWPDEAHQWWRGEPPPNRAALLARVHDEDRLRVETTLEHLRLLGRQAEVEFRLEEEPPRFVRLVAEPCEEEASLILGVLVDVTLARRFEATLERLTQYDELTGIPNRAHFLRAARDMIRQATPERPQLLLCLDVAGLANINDAFGDRAGDELLRTLAQRLAQWAARHGGVASRFGSDEFVALVSLGSESREAEPIEELLATLHNPVGVLTTGGERQELHPRVTLGGAWIPAAGTDVEALLRLARHQQHQAKERGRRYFLTSDAESGETPLLQLESDLHQAIARQEFFVLYQPQRALETQRLVGAEALLRWRHPERGVLPPIQFIPLLEETGLIVEAGRWVIDTVCAQLAAWSDAGLPLRVAINLSPRQIPDDGLVDHIAECLRRHRLPSALLEFEITESLAIRDPERASTMIAAIRSLGCPVALDDFGVGYASLEYMLQFPFDAIKLDMSFVHRLVETPVDRAIVRGVVTMADALDKRVIAEGVETARQADYLHALGVDEIQGWHVGKPMPPADLIGELRKERQRTQ